MPRRQTPAPEEDFTENIVDIDVTSEMEGSFLEYAYSVIYSRALPDARDGLKPVQRRILYMMSQMGLRPDRGHVKSARVVGEVMGKLHPHGDAAIYDAMVRMAQSFSLRMPLIDGHGNFGSLDDGPAAPRYTEARLAAPALALTDHLDEDVVDFVPNYDNQLMQPEVLPAAFPNLLVNGSSGIAVGMATNMAPHNLGEVIAAAQHLIANPEATLEDIIRFVPGPDLPSGGKIVGLDGIRDAYATGRGSFKTRAKVEVEKLTARRTGLVVTELPYGVGPEKVIEKIKDAVTSKKLQGISDIVDLTDRQHGLRLVIELKNGFNPNAVLAQLYRYSPMEDSFGINNVTLVDGQPRTLGLLELLQVYVDHRIGVVRRRTAFRLGKKKDRLHLVEGLLIAIVDIDEVIQIIRSSDEAAAARERLMAIYDLSEIQANYILELRLRQLTKYSRIELEKEQDATAPRDCRAGGDPGQRVHAAPAGLRPNWARFPRSTPRRGGPCCSNRRPRPAPRHGSAGARAAARRQGAAAAARLPTTRAGCCSPRPASWPARRTRSPWRTASAVRARRTLLSVVNTTARAEIGAVTSPGRMLRLPGPGHAAAGRRRPASRIWPAAFRSRSSSRWPRANPSWRWCRWTRCWRIGTAQGMVKRVTPDYPLNREDWETIALKPRTTFWALSVACRRRRTGLHHAPGAAAALPGLRGPRPGAHRGRRGRDQAGRRATRWRSSARSRPEMPAAVVVTVAIHAGRPAGHLPRVASRSPRSPSTRRRAGPPAASARTAS